MTNPSQSSGVLSPSKGGTLYIVATPIGNLEDITLRALRVLKEVALIAAEDTRTTRKLLSHYDIHTPLSSCHEYTSPEKEEYLLDLLAGQDIALVTEAGMPGISDPGVRLICGAIDRGYRVVPVPGPSAVTTAVAVSGLSTDTFLFLGFLPRDSAERVELLTSVAALPHTLVAFESPHRLRDSLADLVEVLDDRQTVICRELTKVHEEVWRGTLRQAVRHFEATEPRGEFTLVIEGAAEKPPAPWTEDQVRALLAERKVQGARARSTVKEVAELAWWPKRDVYQIWIELND
ncbi:MAG: 16S rRNA (cytidine(1402)-2'-O)-methyltransferase [Anaerolineae bacterium]